MNYMLINNQWQSTETVMKTANTLLTIYEVVRVEKGIALFLENHYARMQTSFASAKYSQHLPTWNDWQSSIYLLIDKNRRSEGNIRFDFHKRSTTEHQTAFSFINHHYPTKQEYAKGYEVGLLMGERENPHAKIANQEVRFRANGHIEQEKLDEVLLVNHNQLITEGSKTNFFAIRNNILFTAPDELVLGGIMRQHVLKLAGEIKIEVVKQCIMLNELTSIETAFVTGTSPRIMPISKLNNAFLNTNHSFIEKLTHALNQSINRYISERTNAFH